MRSPRNARSGPVLPGRSGSGTSASATPAWRAAIAVTLTPAQRKGDDDRSIQRSVGQPPGQQPGYVTRGSGCGQLACRSDSGVVAGRAGP